MTENHMLYIATHSFYPPMNGGQLRIYHLLKGLAEEFKITVIYPEPSKATLADLKEHLPHIRFMPIDLHNQSLSWVDKLKSKWYFGFLTPLNLFNTHVLLTFQKQLKDQNFQYIFFEHLQSLGAAGQLTKTYFPKAKRVINLHNIDHELWLAHYQTQPHQKQLLKYSKDSLKSEKQLYKEVDVALVCSQADQNTIEQLNNRRLKTMVVPNGTYIPKTVPERKPRPNSLLFVGALDFFPNVEGLKWFYTKVWPALVKKTPNMSLSIVGKGDLSNLSFISHPQIHLIGEVESVSEYYFNHQISIVPILHGGGTRLKIPEAMAHLTPVVSTPKGAEGHPLVHNKHLMLAEHPDAFAQAIITLLETPHLYTEIQDRAQNWVGEHLDWKQISQKLLKTLLE